MPPARQLNRQLYLKQTQISCSFVVKSNLLQSKFILLSDRTQLYGLCTFDLYVMLLQICKVWIVVCVGQSLKILFVKGYTNRQYHIRPNLYLNNCQITDLHRPSRLLPILLNAQEIFRKYKAAKIKPTNIHYSSQFSRIILGSERKILQSYLNVFISKKFKISHSMKNKEYGYYNKIEYPHFYVRRQHIDIDISQSRWYNNLKCSQQ